MNDKTLRLFQIFSAKLVLEVFGGGGAIWGFSEALGLRTSASVWFWRPCALSFGAIFFVRWLMQICEYMAEPIKVLKPDIVRDTGETVELAFDFEKEGYGSRDVVPIVIG